MPPIDFTVRPAHPGDEFALHLCASGTLIETFAGTLEGEDILAHCAKNNSVEKYTDWLAAPGTHIALAELRQAPIGYAVLCHPDLPILTTSTDIELRRIYLFQRFQGAGVGHTLLNWSAQKARSLGMTRLLLGVYGGNEKAIAWYYRQGFVKAGTRQFLVGATLHDDLILGLLL